MRASSCSGGWRFEDTARADGTLDVCQAVPERWCGAQVFFGGEWTRAGGDGCHARVGPTRRSPERIIMAKSAATKRPAATKQPAASKRPAATKSPAAKRAPRAEAPAERSRVTRMRDVPNIVTEEELDQLPDQPFAEGSVDSLDPDLRHRLVSDAAYQRYVDRGYADGYDLDDWLQAEAAIDHLLLNRRKE
jgi:hypothetical protein